ncbi:MAG TPA: sugar phosphate isomerase/epimerase family protein [Tepidisphaeraceae bacterium]|nr:sugar phosphate isomerase/epimerase family protein [Tepidisphaeraceae bacterium]
MSQVNERISVRDHMIATAANGRQFFDAVRDLGVGAIELEVATDFSMPHLRLRDGSSLSIRDANAVRVLKDALAAHGLRVSALLLATDFSGENAGEHVAWTIRAARAARELGAPAVRVDPLTRDRELTAAQVRGNFVRRIREVLNATADIGVDLAMENHGPIGNDPAFIDGVLNDINDQRLGLTLDTGNFYWSGVPLQELYGLLRRYAPRAKHTHIKNINYPPALARNRREIGLDYKQCCCPLDEGNIDLNRVAEILSETGYRRDLCIENESLFKYPEAQKLDVLRRDVAALRRAMKGS